MIISASRRTDIPAFYSKWLMTRIRAGFCHVPNPFNPKQVAVVSLRPEEVDAIVFWTRNPAPLMPYLDELDGRGYRYYFLYTLLGYAEAIDPHCPPFGTSLERFGTLAERVGAGRVIWRYDPILLTARTGIDYHIERFQQIAEALRGHTRHAVISLVDPYPAHKARMQRLGEAGFPLITEQDVPEGDWERLFSALASAAVSCEMSIQSCAETLDLTRYGIIKGACIDAGYLRDTFGLKVAEKKDPHQRAACRCVPSKDIGMYGTCLMGCAYCYATANFERAREVYRQHDPDGPSIRD